METSKNNHSIILQHFVVVVLFILIPLLAVIYIGQYIINLESRRVGLEISEKVKDGLRDIEIETESSSFLLKIAKSTWFEYKRNENNKDNFWVYYNNLCEYLKSKPDLYMFDADGKLVTPQNYILKSRFLASKLWNTIDDSFEGKSNTAKKFKKQFKSFLGSEFRLGSFLESRNRLMPIIINAKPGYIYWMTTSDKKKEGILIIFWELPSFDFCFKQILNSYSSDFDELFVMNNNGSIYYHQEGRNIAELKPEYEKIYYETFKINNDKQHIDSKGLIWRHSKFHDSVLFGALKSDYFKYKFYNYLLLIIVFFVGLLQLLIYIWTVREQNCFLSIRAKLIALFFVAVFTPVASFGFLGFQFITDLQDNNHINIWKKSREILLDIDRELGTSGNVFVEEFRKMVKNYQHYDENPTIREDFAANLVSNDLVEIDRRLASDASLISQITNYTVYENMNEVTEPFAKCCIDETSNTNLMNTIDPVLRNALKSPESALSSFWHKPDRVQEFALGATQFYLYWNYAESSKYGKEYFLIIRSMDKVLQEHLHKRLMKCKTNPLERNFLIYAYNNKTNEWFPDNSLEQPLKAFSKRLYFTGKPKESHIEIGSKLYLLFGVRGFKLNDYSFYALYPHEKIDDEVIEARNDIIIHIILFVVTALIIGFLLSKTFVYPIKSLEKGIKAIKERNSDFRIEPLENDEFGNLAINFNKMITDLKEMDLAKSIQESLLPSALPKLKGYEISFSNKMASAVGGDYFDAFMLDEDNLCVIIGDVSGHGVASALVMAIAKSVLYNGFKETRNLIELFGDLNSVVNTYFGKPPVKKMITLFASIINLPTGDAVFLDAGHNFPIKISADGQITELKMENLPIGILKKLRKIKTENYTINKGETIVFYTDGITEATGKTDEQYGLQRFKENLSLMAQDDSETIKNRLLENYNKWEDGTEPDDDVTLVILKRLAS
jgi:hypothetical protein